MREITATLGGEEITLAANFKASMEIAEKVADPLAIAREAALEAMFSQALQAYDPRFRFTVKNVPQILHIGMKAAGDKRTLEQVQEMVFDAGFPDARDIAIEYIATVVTPKSEEVTDEPKDAPSGE